jgi:hydroxyethylthiazole kinase-like uncharacterized protein yjeF
MEKLMSITEMQAIEREANEKGLSYALMIENAGTNIAEWLNNAHSHIINKNIIALIGSGNNGGDTLFALCKLIEYGWRPTAYFVLPRSENDILVKNYLNLGGLVIHRNADVDYMQLSKLLKENTILLDGVLGTGFKLPLNNEIARVLDFVRTTILNGDTKILVVAVDCPSGIQCDSGEAGSETIPANVTFTMAGFKYGLIKFPAAALVGEVKVGGIGDLDSLCSWNNIRRGIVTETDVRNVLPARPRDAHKGTFGTAMVVAGSGNYPGAAILAGEAAYRSGAGLVTIAIPELIHSAIAGSLVEATWLRLPHLIGWISAEGIQMVIEAIIRTNAILIGPGLGVEETTAKFIAGLVKADPGNIVFDADGLKLLSRIPDWYSQLSQDVILTPHPGEMAILTGMSREYIQANRIEVAENFAKKWQKIVVLKGAFTVISEPKGSTYVIPVATPALARAGTGDVLAGIIVGLLAQKMDVFQAAYVGAWIHGQAGLEAERQFGNSSSVLASDVLRAVSKIITNLAI